MSVVGYFDEVGVRTDRAIEGLASFAACGLCRLMRSLVLILEVVLPCRAVGVVELLHSVMSYLLTAPGVLATKQMTAKRAEGLPVLGQWLIVSIAP